MAIEFVCPACHGTLSVADDAVGRVVRCGSCLTTLRVPEPAAGSRPEPEAAPPPRPRPRPVEPVEPPGSRGDLDEHGEPRRRRRRGATQKTSGRSPLFWLFMVILLLGFLTCLSCGGIILALATPRWHTHESAKGGFKVDLPAPINPEIAEQAKVDLKGNEKVEGTMLVGRLEAYWVWYAEIDPQFRGVNDDAILKETIKNLTKETPGTVMRETPKNVDGFPGMEVVIVHEHQSDTYHCLIVVTKSHVYIAAAGGPFVSSAGNKRTRKFLDSFHILKGGNAGNPWRGNAAPKKDE